MRIAFTRWRSGGLFNHPSPRKRLLPKKKTSSGFKFVSGLSDGASAMPAKWSRPVFSFRFYEGKISRNPAIAVTGLGPRRRGWRLSAGRWWHIRRRLGAGRRLPVALPEVGVARLARRHEFRVDLRQWLARPWPLRRSLHNRSHAIDLQAVARPGAAAHESRLLAGCENLGARALARSGLQRTGRTQRNRDRADRPEHACSVHHHCSSSW